MKIAKFQVLPRLTLLEKIREFNKILEALPERDKTNPMFGELIKKSDLRS